MASSLSLSDPTSFGESGVFGENLPSNDGPQMAQTNLKAQRGDSDAHRHRNLHSAQR